MEFLASMHQTESLFTQKLDAIFVILKLQLKSYIDFVYIGCEFNAIKVLFVAVI